MKIVAFVTCAELPDLTASDRLPIPLLAEMGIHVQSVIWDSQEIDWHTFDAIILRSVWDYHHRYTEFMAWLDALPNHKVWNPVEVVRWNANKIYLRDLPNVVPTVWLDEQANLANILQEKNWQRAVIKPTISASAHGTWVTSPAQAAEHQHQLQNFAVPMMLQPFVPQIETEGEWSLLFFGGKFSHAVLKKPAAGDFRVQDEFGGTIETRTPPAHLIDQAQKIIASVASPLLYVRVDGVNNNGDFQLMELELIEPHLYLGDAPHAAENFALAIRDFVG